MLDYSRKVILSIFVIAIIGTVPLAYAAVADFITSFDGDDFGSGVTFEQPAGVTTDSNNRIIVADTDNTRDIIQIFDSSGTFVVALSGGTAFGIADSIATDASNRIFVADTDLNTIQIYDSTGLFLSTFDGSQGAGETFTALRGVTVDSTNRILVVDIDIDKVQIYEGFPIPGGGSSDVHKTRPTFGLDHNTFNQLVEGGFSFNGVSHDITDNWWTPFAEQEVKIGTINTFTAKVYTDKQLRVQEFLFGIPDVGDGHKAELGVEIFYDSSGKVETINAVQKTKVIDIDSIKVIPSKSNCTLDDSDERCYTTTLSMKFLEPLQDKIMAIKAIDYNGRTHTTYLNEGFDISGVSLNPMITMMIIGTEKYEGLVEITQTAKYSDIWRTEDDRVFEINSYGSAKQINQSFERHIDTDVMRDRMHSEFSMYKQEQSDLALGMMEAYYRTSINYEEPFSEINDIFSYEYTTQDDRINDVLIQQEISKANAIMEKLCPECGDLPFDKLTDHIFLEYIQVDETIVQAILQQEYLDAVEKFNQRYGNIYNIDIVESVDTTENTSKIDTKELSQIEISKALEIFKQYRNVYGQD